MVAVVGRLLDGETLTATTVAELLGVERAAGVRWLKQLARLPGAKGARTTEPTLALERVVPREPVSDTALAGICLVSSLATALQEAGMAEPVARLREELVRRSKHQFETGDLDRKFWFVTRGGEKALPKAKIRLGETIHAILDAKELTFDYGHFDGRREQAVRVQPLTLAVHEHQFYVIARRVDVSGAREASAPHPFRFARMTNVRAGKSYDYPPVGRHDPRQLFQGVFGIFVGQPDVPVEKVRLRFAAKWASYVDSHRWHDTQVERPLPGGGVEVDLQVRDCPELRQWILGFGPDLEVLGPARLREEVAASLAAGATLYARALAAGPTTAKAKVPARRPRATPSLAKAASPARRSRIPRER